MAVDVRVDRGNLAERRLVQLLQDLELDARLGSQRAERFGERRDDRRRSERVRLALEDRLAEQMADAAVQRDQLLVADVLDDAHDVADQHGLVDRAEVDQRELRRVDLREIELHVGAAGNVVLDVRPQTLLELGHQAGAVDDQHLARLEKLLLLLAQVGLPGALHQHVAHAIEQRREREQEPVDRDVPAIGEDFRQLPGDGAAGRRNAGRYVLGRHGRSVSGIGDQCATSGFRELGALSAIRL